MPCRHAPSGWPVLSYSWSHAKCEGYTFCITHSSPHFPSLTPPTCTKTPSDARTNTQNLPSTRVRGCVLRRRSAAVALDAPPASHADADVTAPLPLPHGTMSGAPKRGGVRGPFIAFYHFAPPYPLATPPSLLAVWSRHLNNPRPICLLCISVLLRALILGLSRTCFLSLSSG